MSAWNATWQWRFLNTLPSGPFVSQLPHLFFLRELFPLPEECKAWTSSVHFSSAYWHPWLIHLREPTRGHFSSWHKESSLRLGGEKTDRQGCKQTLLSSVLILDSCSLQVSYTRADKKGIFRVRGIKAFLQMYGSAKEELSLIADASSGIFSYLLFHFKYITCVNRCV